MVADSPPAERDRAEPPMKHLDVPSPAIRPATSIPAETSRIVDWAIWVDGEGVIEGAGTGCLSWLAGGAGDQARSAEAWLAAYGGSLQSR